ncbi:MAG: hypothetical protein ACOX4F_08650 [Atopobiaceae bacterium]
MAEAIASAIGLQAYDIKTPLTEDVDMLFLCTAVYAAGVDDAVKYFLRNPGVKIGNIVNISTAALFPSTYKQVERLALEQSIRMDEREFHCRGEFLGLHRGRPDEHDLKAAQEFARAVVGKAYLVRAGLT